MEEELVITKIVKPTLKETYALLLEDEKEAFIGGVIELVESDNIVVIQNLQNEKKFQFLLKDDELVFKSTTPKYHILDIERVIPFDLTILKEDIEQLNKQLTSDIIEGLDISLEEILEKDKSFTPIELREDVLSNLVFSFNAYDNIQQLQSLNDTVDNLLELINNKDDKTVYLYNIHRDKPLPKWLIPVIDNPLKITQEYDALTEFFDIKDQTQLQYNQLNQMLLQSYRPVEPSLSDIGYYTNNVVGYSRNCLTGSTCLSSAGNYKYDMRRNKHHTQSIFDGNVNIIHPSDSLNIVGLLSLSTDELKHMIPYDNNLFTLNEKTLFNNLVNTTPYKTLKNSGIITESIKSGDLPQIVNIDQNIYYTFDKRYETNDDFINTVYSITPKINDLLISLNDDIKSRIVNYKDFKTLCIQYEINPYELIYNELELINSLISSNVEEYLQKTPSLKKISIDEIQPQLTNEQKISMSLDSILSMTNIPVRNEYIQKFIKTYTRNNTPEEENLWLYNKYNNQKLLCKHYELLSVYHRDKDAFNTMVTVYGRTPEDGVIHCKNCGCYLCDEDFSLFDGFTDEQPILLREEIVKDINLLEGFKEPDILLVKQLSQSLGVSLNDEDILLLLETQKSLNNDIIANIRYKTQNITVTDEHPRVKDIRKKHAKEKNKKKLIQKDIIEFQSFIKDSNKLIEILSLLCLIIHTSVPSYEIKKGKNLSFINFKDITSLDTVDYNMKYIDFVIHNISKFCDIYKTEALWLHFKECVNESKTYDLPSLRNQIMNTIYYLLSPQYPRIQEKLLSYRTHLLSSKNVYVNYEWPLFKPLVKSNLSNTVNTLLKQKEDVNFPNYILNYNSYPVENISLLMDIETSKYKLIYELVDLDVSEIMVNKAFLLLFHLSVSNYGNKIQTLHSVDLHIERFLQTVSKTDEMRSIFKKHKWESSLKTGGISYKTLRTKIIPEIIGYYLKIDTDLSPCFSHEKICNQFIHTNVNNYDLHLLKTQPKRIYYYKRFVVYPELGFSDLSDEFKENLFKRYCKDPSGNIIKRFITIDYLGKYLLDTHKELEDSYLGVYEHKLHMDEKNFKEIMNAVQCALPLQDYIQPKIYNIDDYNLIYHKTSSLLLNQLRELLTKNNNYELSEDTPLLLILEKLFQTESYDSKQLPTMQREINKTISELTMEPFINNFSEFVPGVTDKKQVKRFESIFINTSTNINISEEERTILQGDGFRYKNMRISDINKVFNLFIEGEKLTTELCYHYMYSIQHILSRLSHNYTPQSGISTLWKLKEHDKHTMNDYIVNNSMLLHQDIFRRNPTNRGFYKYGNSPLFQCLYEYIEPFTVELDKLSKTDLQLLTPPAILILHKYIFSFIISKLIEFYNLLKSEDDELIAVIESKFLSSDNELNILECIDVTEKFIMDLIINIFEIHYDSRWIVSNHNLDDLSQRLSKQKEKEKQQLIQELDTMTDEKRASTVELQKIGVTSMYHQSIKRNEKRIIDEYSSIDEGYDEIDNKEIVDTAVSISNGEIVESSVLPIETTLETVEEGYYNENDFDEDGVMGDEMQSFHQEDLLDNDFAV